MSPELITMAILATPAAVIGPVCIAGHRWARRQDAAIATAFHPAPAAKTPPTGPGEPIPAPEPLAKVITLPTPRAEDTDQAQSA